MKFPAPQVSFQASDAAKESQVFVPLALPPDGAEDGAKAILFLLSPQMSIKSRPKKEGPLAIDSSATYKTHIQGCTKRIFLGSENVVTYTDMYVKVEVGG